MDKHYNNISSTSRILTMSQFPDSNVRNEKKKPKCILWFSNKNRALFYLFIKLWSIHNSNIRLLKLFPRDMWSDSQGKMARTQPTLKRSFYRLWLNTIDSLHHSTLPPSYANDHYCSLFKRYIIIIITPGLYNYCLNLPTDLNCLKWHHTRWPCNIILCSCSFDLSLLYTSATLA